MASMHKNYTWKILCIVHVLFVFSSKLLAFEGAEHKHVGNLSLKIAVDYIGFLEKGNVYWTLSRQGKCRLYSEYLSLLGECGESNKNKATYGDIVKLVDFMDYPREIFESQSYEQREVARSFLDLKPELIREKDESFTVNLMRAASNNEYHFQAGLFNSLVNLHYESVNRAQQGHIFAALVTNALSDHFLHDYFAPGHITTTRENSHDAVALGMHDKANQTGAVYKIDSDRWEHHLDPILQFILDNQGKEKGRYKLFLPTNEQYNIGLPEAARLLSRKEAKIKLVGDNDLNKNQPQQLYMILVSIRSVLDVLNSHAERNSGREIVNNFRSYVWSGTFDDKNKKDVVPEAKLPFGEYEINPELMSEASNILILTVGGDSPIKDILSSRLLLEAEVVPLSFIGASDFLRKHTINRPTTHCRVFSVCNLAPTIGWAYINDDNGTANGPILRVIKAFPKIDTQISLYYKYLNFEHFKRRKNSYGFRFDTGFSLYSAYIAIGKSHFETRHEELLKDTVITFGISIGVPFSRMGFR